MRDDDEVIATVNELLGSVTVSKTFLNQSNQIKSNLI